MKKIYTILVCLCLLAGFVACEKDKDFLLTKLTVQNETITPSYGAATIDCSFKADATISEAFVQYSLSSSFAKYDVAKMTEEKGKYAAQLTGLQDNTTYYIRYAVSNKYSSVVSEDVIEFQTLQCTVPTVALDSIADVWDNRAKAYLHLAFDGGASVTDMGVCWGTQANPTTKDIHVSTEDTLAVLDITSLQSNTRYYVRAYAMNKVGVAYSEEKVFTTLALPEVCTEDVSDIQVNSALLSATLVFDGNDTATIKGFCWSEKSEPTIEGDHIAIDTASAGYTYLLTALLPETQYFVRAYAQNKIGIVYGEEVSFTTKEQSSTEPVVTETITVNGVSFKMVAVGGGTFTMGATSEQGSDAGSNESPTHSVTLSDFAIGETEVTQELWKAVMGSNPSYFSGTNLPVESVSWNDCQTFISKLNNLTGKNFRLPTEAEWEYAARGGNKSKGYKYAGSNTLGDVAWYDANSSSMTHPVKQKQANELGLYDMSGNVWEWCQDWYGSYSSSAQTNPTGPTSGSDRVDRGGNFAGIARHCCVSLRDCYAPEDDNYNLGLRLALGAAVELEVALPTLTTNAVTQITETTAVAGGNVTADGNASVTERGIVYGKSPNPTISNLSNTIRPCGSGMGEFTYNMTDLQPGTTYYVRAYATNEKGTAYGEEVTFITNKQIVLPSVTTATVTQITETTAVAGGNVTSDGGSSVTERGVVYATTQNPTTADNKVLNGSSMGTFTCILTNLQPNTTYYVRAYATNSMGTAYGEEVSFTTEEEVVAIPEYVDLGLSVKWATFNVGATKPEEFGDYFAWGETEPKEKYDWSTYKWCNGTDANMTKYNATDGKIILELEDDAAYMNWGGNWRIPTMDEMNELSYQCTWTVINKNGVNGYKVTSKSNSNSIFIPFAGYYNGSLFTDVDVNGYYWSSVLQSNGHPNFAWRVCLKGFTTNTCNKCLGHSIRPVYGEYITYNTPTITTNIPTQITSTTAVAGGNVTSDGGASVTERGVVYATTQNPTTNNIKVKSGTGTGSFTCNLTGLQQNTTYYVRAYAINSKGTAYGEEVSFTTNEEMVDNPPSNLVAMPFSVSADKQVTFSKGNLQYHPANNEWRFAENQTDYIGDANSNCSSTYNGWLDLFGWSAGSTNYGLITSIYVEDYSGSFVDWGTNKIGNDAANIWRTLTYSEWNYLLNYRTNANSLYGVAHVNGVNGLIFLPDNWICPESVTFKSGYHSSYGVDYYAAYQNFTADQWSALEVAGAIFLPAAGSRIGSDVSSVQLVGRYWFASKFNNSAAYTFHFLSDDVSISGCSRENGISVRLVRDL